MRRLILCLTAILLILSSMTLQAKKDPAGEVIGDSTYCDAKYGFTLKVGAGWKVAKIQKNKDICRLKVTKKNPVVPPKMRGNEISFLPPKLTVLAEPIDLSIDSLKILLTKQEKKADIIKQAMKDFETLSFSQFRPVFNEPMKVKVGDFKGIVIHVRKEYHYTGNSSVGAGSSVVAGFVRGMIYIVQNDETTIVLEAVSEMDRFGFIERDFEFMIKSLTVPDKKNVEKM
jgi:hypothetical protein